jgi:Tfp pilus assembly protein PilO
VSQRDRIVAVVAAALAVFAGGWFFISKPQREEAKQLDEQLVAAQATLDGAAARAAQYRAARRSLQKHPEAFEKAGKALPNRVAMPDLLRTLTRTAKGTGVTVGDLATKPGTSTTPGISTVDLDLTFNGDFLSLQRYLARLQRFVEVSQQKVDAKGRLLTLNSVKLARPDAETAGLSAKVAATVYVLQPGALAAGQAAPAPAGAATTPAPATGAAAAPAVPATTGGA